jgi:beta-N-acetylhexosaminidase
MAAELRQLGIDFSFAPVLDVECGVSQVIGDRAFATTPEVVANLAAAWLDGVHGAGMSGCGKHFPGHGGVVADSHLELPEDPRTLAALEQADLLPYRRLIANGLEAVMPAHVRYLNIDPEPAGFSTFWLRRMLRGRLRFDGAIISDDLNMAAADAGGAPAKRALAALQAGCDMLLICNNRPAACSIVDAVGDWQSNDSVARLERLRGRSGITLEHPSRRAAALTAAAALAS